MRKRRQFSPEFKEEMVSLVLDKGRRISEVVREYDLTESALRRWLDQARIDRGLGPSSALTTEERDELKRLRRENQRLRTEREILKKAAAFFAKENQ